MTDKKLLDRLANLSPEQREALFKQLQKKKAQGAEPKRDVIKPYVRESNRLAMSYAQQRLWFIDQLQSGSASYNISAALRLKGSLDVEALRMSFEEIVCRHEVLRTVFITDEGQGRQVIQEPQRWELPTISLEPLSPDEQEEVIRARFKGDAHTSFDLINGPLLRTRLIRLGISDHVIIVSMHHIISDGWSMGVLIREMALLYDAYRQDKSSPLKDLPIQYADYSIWQREWLSGERLERQLSYWKTRLDGIPTLELPTDFPRPPVHNYQGKNLHFSLSPETTQALNALSKSQGATLFMTLFAALQVLLHRYTGQDDVCIGTPIAGRVRPEVESLIGCFVNTLAIRGDLSENPTFIALLKQVQQNLTGAYDHQDIPFERLVDELGVPRELSHTPLFQVMFVLQNATNTGALSLPGLAIELLPEESETSKFDLTINLREENGRLIGDWEYRTDLFEQTTIERMIGHYECVLKALLANPGIGVDDIDYLSAAEKQTLLVDWNQTQSEYERDSDILDVFEQVAERFADRIALTQGGSERELTYRELHNLSNGIATELIELGVKPGQRVGLCAERSIESIAAILGILKTGAAYIPLDPAYPQDRLQYMVEDTEITWVIAHSHLAEQLPVSEQSIIALEKFHDLNGTFADPGVRVGPNAAAYVMYTSGSTGKPKGIEVVHRGVVRLVRNTNYMDFNSDIVFLQYAPISFDAANIEIWGPLLNGGRLVVAPPGQLTPEELGQTMRDGGVNSLWLTTALFHYFAEFHTNELKMLRHVITGGDVISATLARKAMEEVSGLTLINAYGPTENTSFTTFYVMNKVGDVRHAVPIGKPISNTTVYILDKNKKPVPVGVPGELYTSGDGVANGYLHRDELTAEVFISNPYASTSGQSMYKTGDLVRYTHDGNIEFLSRVDMQVKIRGFRIELGEVESAISKINTIRSVAVVAREDVPRVKRLVAYYVPVEGAYPTVGELRSELKQSLPDYMVPSAFVCMDRLPVNANGKLDRKALPKPQTEADDSTQRILPRTEKETILADIWKQVLNLEDIGVRDNFFEVGGDSILSIQIISRAKLAGLHITTKQIFENQTIEELADVANTVESPIIADQGAITGDVLLSPIQQWFFERRFSGEHHWNQSVLLSVKPDATLDKMLIQTALMVVIEQHDALRARFKRTADGVLQWFAEPAADQHFNFTEYDLAHIPAADLDTEITQACDCVQSSLNLEHGPILAAAILSLPQGERRLLLVVHHLVVDGVSWRILLEDFSQALQKNQQQQAVDLGYKTTSYKQWVESLQEFVQQGQLNDELTYWEAITDQHKPRLPLDYPGGSATVIDTVTHSICLSESQTQSLLRDVHRAYRTEINDILLTALARTLSDWSGNYATLLDLEGHGREMFSEKLDLSRTVGWFTSVYPVRLTYENGLSIPENLKSIKEQLRHIPHRGFGYGALRYLGADPQKEVLVLAPKADVVFNYLGQFDSIIDNNPWFALAQESRGHEHSLNSEDPHPLSINSHIVEGKLQVDWIYSQSIFKPATIERLSSSYSKALDQIITHCSQPGVFGYTPSDFPLAGLDQGQIDRLVGNERAIVSIYPLSPMQEGMLFHSLFDNDHGVYFEQLSVELLGGVDRELLKKAWSKVVNRHPALRSAFVWQDIDRPLQIVYQSIDMEVQEFDWRHIDTDQEQPRLDVLLEKDRARGFEFDRPGLMRLIWVDLPDNRARLIWSFHHIVLDGWSLPLVMGEVFQTYGALAKGDDPRLPQSGSYEEFISYLEKVDKGDALQFWKLYLAEFEAATPLPNKKSIDAGAEKNFGEQHLKLSESFTSRLQQFAREQHVTLNTLIQAAWGVLLARYSGEKDVVFGTTVSGRPADLPNVENIVGLFINTLPLRISLSESTTIAPLLQKMQEEQLDLRRFEFTPLVDIHRHSDVPGDQSLFDSILVFENYPVGEAVHSADELLDFGHITTIEHTNFPLTVIVEPSDQLFVKLSYDSGLFDPVSIDRVLEHLETLLHGMLSQPDVPLLRLPILSEDERNKVLHAWNPGPANYPRNLTLHQIFERHAKAHPDLPAVISGTETLSYFELNRRSNQLARYLTEQGVKDGHFVAIALQRSVDMIVCTLATLKVGAAYVPVDPDYPDERITFMLKDSRSRALITLSDQSKRLSEIVSGFDEPVNIVVLDQEHARIEAKSIENPLNVFDGNPLRNAYVVYTSGTTGNPKGVLVNQMGVIRLVLDANYVSIKSNDRVTHLSNVSFDASTFEVWAPLLNGAAMVLFTKEQLLNPELFLQERDRSGANICFLTTALFNMYMTTKPEIVARFKYLMVGGESLDPNKIRQALRHYKPTNFMNIYGPTENTTFSTFCPLEHLSESAINVPIGRSITGSSSYILDEYLQPVPVGVKGELYVGGDGVAIGYLNDEVRTNASFIQNPFSSRSQDRLYKTGDIARYTEDGLIELMGRADDQVKIRGFRIELSEVESNLNRIDEVVDAIVVVKLDSAQQKRLVAYIKTDAEMDHSDVREKALAFLPKHMMPAAFVLMKKFPLTSNGKVDKRALPEPSFETSKSHEYMAPRNEKEKILANIWEQVLKADTVGVHDNFFELGGDSILSIQIISRAKRAGLQITAKQIFDYQSIAELADVAKELQEIILAEQGLVVGDMPLTPIQHWYLEKDPIDPHYFNQSVMLKVDKKVSAENLLDCWESLLSQHDALRLAFVKSKNGSWKQRFVEVENFSTFTQSLFEIVNLSGLPQNLRIDQMETLAQQAQSSLNLKKGPLIKVVYFDLGGNSDSRMLVIIHHLIVDVFSWRVILEDLQTALASVIRGARVQLGAKTTAFKQWSEALQSLPNDTGMQRDIEFWSEQSHDQLKPLPVDNDGDNSVGNTLVLERELSKELTERLLKETSKAFKTEINDILLTALSRNLSNWIDSESVLVDLEGHGREPINDHIDVSRTVGWFTTVYPVRLNNNGSLDIADNIKSIKESLRKIPCKGMTYGVLRYLATDTAALNLHQMPDSQISFNYLGQLDQVAQEGSLLSPADEKTGNEISPNAQRRYLLEIGGRVMGGKLVMSWRYGQNIHATKTIEQLADHFIQELENVVGFCASGEHFGHTPSDFPLAELTQQQVDTLLPSQRIDTVLPLSPVQEGMLFHALYEPGSWVYFDQVIVPINGYVDESAMLKSWQVVVDRHQILRAGFLWEGITKPLQVVMEHVDVQLQQYDWSAETSDSAQHKLDRFLIDDRNLGFNFRQAGVMRLTWIKMPNQDSRLIWSFHHILLDGWSMPIVFRELFATYESMVNGAQIQLPSAPRYQDFIDWMGRQSKQNADAFWSQYLEGFHAPTAIPVKNSAAVIAQKNNAHDAAARYREQSIAISGSLLDGLQNLAKQHRLTLNHIMQGVWAILLHRYSNENDVLFGTTVSGRPADLPGIESMVGLFINTLPMRMLIEKQASFIDWLQRIQETQAEIKNFEYSSLVDVQSVSALSSKQAMFESILVFENYPIDESLEASQASLNVGDVQAFQQTNFPLTLIIIPGKELELRFSYDSHVFDPSTIDRMLVHIEHLLLTIEGNPQVVVEQLPVLSMREQKQLVHTWNDTARLFASDSTLIEIFEKQVNAHPDQMACEFGDQRISYDTLNRRANKLSRLLIEKGVAPGQPIAISFERSLSMIETMLAVLKSGAVYVPVDPSYPQERVEHMIVDTGAPLLITSAELLSEYSYIGTENAVSLLALETLLDQAAALPDGNPNLKSSQGSQALAYIIYTSGSTGKPKGVCVPQIAVSRLVMNTDYVNLQPGHRMGHASNVSFDAATFELWGALLNGGTLVGVDKDTALNPERFAETIESKNIQVLFLTTALFNALSKQNATVFSKLDYCLFGGEACDPNQVRDVLEGQGKPQHLLHVYGPTENTTFSTWYEINEVLPEVSTIPIGKPIANSTLYVLDDLLRPVPIGVAGEIYVGGLGLATGYLNRSDLNADAFIDHPFIPDQRLYKTGDLGHMLESGDLEILGRIDDQVKIRGYRIELGEIEAVMNRQPGIQQTSVIVRTLENGSKQLIAYCVPKQSEQIGPIAEVRAKLKQHLPDYMVPSAIVIVDAIAITPNGKVDKRALPEPSADDFSVSDYVAPRNPTEETLVMVWQEILELDRVGIYDDFFDLGGHSLLINKVAMRLKQQLGIELPLRTLFEVPTIASLAEIINVLKFQDADDESEQEWDDEDFEEGSL